jgi:hypothetical protein
MVDREQAVGEPIAVAAALRSLAPPNSVLVAESTRKLLTDVFVCENPEPHHLAGLVESVTACRVTRRRTVGSRFNGFSAGEGYTAVAERDFRAGSLGGSAYAVERAGRRPRAP